MALQAFDNFGGGDCAFYAFALGLLDVIKKQLASHSNSDTLTCLKQNIKGLTKDDYLAKDEELKKTFDTFLDGLEGNIIAFDPLNQRKHQEFLQNFQKILRHLTCQKILRDFENYPADKVNFIATCSKEKTSLLILDHNFDETYEKAFLPLLQSFLAYTAENPAISYISNSDQYESNSLEILKFIKYLLQRSDLQTALLGMANSLEIIDTPAAIAEVMSDKVMSIDKELLISTLDAYSDECSDIAKENVLLFFQKIFLNFLAKRRPCSTQAGAEEPHKTELLELSYEINLEHDQLFIDLYSDFSLIYRNGACREHKLPQEMAAKTTKLVQLVKKYEASSQQTLNNLQKKKIIRAYFFELDHDSKEWSTALNDTAIEAILSSKNLAFNEKSIAAKYINEYRKEGKWGTEQHLLALASLFSENLSVKIYRSTEARDSQQCDPDTIYLINSNNRHWTTLCEVQGTNNSLVKTTKTSAKKHSAKKNQVLTPLDIKELANSINALANDMRLEPTLREIKAILTYYYLPTVEEEKRYSETTNAGVKLRQQLKTIDDYLKPNYSFTEDGKRHPITRQQYRTILACGEYLSKLATQLADEFAKQVKPNLWTKFLALLGFKKPKAKINNYERLKRENGRIAACNTELKQILGDDLSDLDLLCQAELQLAAANASLSCISSASAGAAQNNAHADKVSVANHRYSLFSQPQSNIYQLADNDADLTLRHDENKADATLILTP